MKEFKKYKFVGNDTYPIDERNNSITTHFQQVINYYNNAFSYIKTLPSFHIGYSYATKKLIDFALNYTTFNDKNVFEIGCGHGKTMFHLVSQYNIRCTGIDLNSKQIDYVNSLIAHKKLTHRLSALKLNALSIDSELGSFDIVLSEDVFAHIPQKEILFQNINKILKKNGILVFSDSVKTNMATAEELSDHEKAWNLWKMESKESYLAFLKNSGFKILGYEENIGKELLAAHIKEDDLGGDFHYNQYMDYLLKNRECLLNEWGEYTYKRRLERLKAFEYFENGILDYNFVVAVKD